jgi:hypothetical protein
MDPVLAAAIIMIVDRLLRPGTITLLVRIKRDVRSRSN